MNTPRYHYFSNAKKIATVAELETVPNKSIIWYPSHGDSYGEFLTQAALQQLIKDNPERGDEFVISDDFLKLVRSDINELDIGPMQPGLEYIHEVPALYASADEVDIEDPTTLNDLSSFIENALSKGYSFYRAPYGDYRTSDKIMYHWIFD